MKETKSISVKDFSPEELRKWQLKLLEILVYFRDFCEEHKLFFMLAGGTCLGAVRHKGFIPWDDDIDVQMPRDDYEKLIRIWNKEADTSKFVCDITTKNYCSKFPMAVIRSVNTTCIYDHSINSDICQGLKIDVEFLDGVPENKYARKFNLYCAYLLSLFRAQRVPARASKLKKRVSYILLKLFSSNSVRWMISRFCENRIMRYKYKDHKTVRYLFCSLQEKSAFEEVVYFDFEGYKMPIPAGYDSYLRSAYHDYMKFPPENKRKPATDNLFFYDLDHSYKDYKGLKYCVK